MKVQSGLTTWMATAWATKWPSRAMLALLCVGLCLEFAAASPLFAGVSAIESRQEQGAQVVEFRSDLPFQYQLETLDRDHVVLRLYNAQLAKNLLLSDGSVNLLAGGGIQSARLRSVNNKTHATVTYQELLLTGSALGASKIKVLGATELPSQKTIAKKPTVVRPGIVNLSERTAAEPEQPVTMLANSPESSVAQAERRIEIASAALDTEKVTDFSSKSVALPLVTPVGKSGNAAAARQNSPSKAAPVQIESVTNAGRSSRPAIASPPVTHRLENLAMMAPPSYLPQPQAPTVNQTAATEAIEPPEPNYQVLMAIPRYQGGAKPIQAITTDRNGQPVVVRPKNQPIPEFDMNGGNGGFNALFQADTGGSSVNHLMASALEAYRQNNHESALQQIRQALAMDAENADLYAALGEIEVKLNQPKQAADAYGKARQLASNAGESTKKRQYDERYAQLLVMAGRRTEAIETLKSLYKANAKQGQVAYMLGTLYEELGQTQEALPYLTQAVTLHPGSADVHYNLGLALELTGDGLQAEKHYREAINLKPSFWEASQALGRVRAMQGQ